MVRIGERTGRMQEIAESLHAYYGGRDALARELRTSVVYPLVMAGMVLVVIFVLTVAVMPVFEQVFKQLGLAMNPFSLSLLQFGQAFSKSALVILIVVTVFVLVFFLLRFTKKAELCFRVLMILLHLHERWRRLSPPNDLLFFHVADAGKWHLYCGCTAFRGGS